MRKILLFIVLVQNLNGMKCEKDGVSVDLSRAPLLICNTSYKSRPLLLSVINSTKAPLVISLASFSRPILTLEQAHSALYYMPGIRIFNSFLSSACCIGAGYGLFLLALRKAFNVNQPEYCTPLYLAGGLTSLGLLMALALASASDSDNPIAISALEACYLSVPIVIKPLDMIDKLILLDTDTKGPLKISIFLPNNDSLDFDFTADQLADLAYLP